MKTYMALDGLRWSRDSGSANCDMPRSAVFGRSGGGDKKSRRKAGLLSMVLIPKYGLQGLNEV